MIKPHYVPFLIALWTVCPVPGRAELVSLFTFDDPRNRYANTGGGPDASPVTGIGPYGIPVAAPTFAEGVIGSAAELRGLSREPLKAIDTSANALPRYDATNRYGLWTGSISFWFKTTSTKYVTFLANRGAGDSDFSFITVWGDGGDGKHPGNLQFQMRTGPGKWGHRFYFDNKLDDPTWKDGGWHHVTFTWKMPVGGGEGSGAIYVDGKSKEVQVTPNRIVPGDEFKAWGRGVMGTDVMKDLSVGGGGPFSFDEMAVFNVWLTAGQVKAIHDLANTGTRGVKHGVGEVQALFDFYASATEGATIGVGRQTWKKIGRSVAFDGPGGVSGDFLALGADGSGVQVLPK